MALSVFPCDLGDAVVLDLVGEIDLSAVPQLRDAIATALGNQPGYVLLDLARVTFIDCAGIGTLIEGRNTAEAKGIGYRVDNAQGLVATILAATGTLAYLSGSDPGG
jgi:anti-anti-sigma factor